MINLFDRKMNQTLDDLDANLTPPLQQLFIHSKGALTKPLTLQGLKTAILQQ